MFSNFKTMHELHAPIIGLLAYFLSNNNLTIGAGVGLFAWVYMSNFGHGLPFTVGKSEGLEMRKIKPVCKN
jgi:hypothetical protein